MKTLIVPISAIRRREKDSYNEGCDPDTTEERRVEAPNGCTTVVECMSEIVGVKLKPEEVYTLDPNVYCDSKTPPGFRVVKDNAKAGRFRVEHDRLENVRGRAPTTGEMNRFKRSEITLWHTTYELQFEIRLVDMGEEELAKYLGVAWPG